MKCDVDNAWVCVVRRKPVSKFHTCSYKRVRATARNRTTLELWLCCCLSSNCCHHLSSTTYLQLDCSPMAPGEGDTGVVLGENLIPLINRLQDIFSQERLYAWLCAACRQHAHARIHIDAHTSAFPPAPAWHGARRSRWTLSSACLRWLSSAARAAGSPACWRPW